MCLSIFSSLISILFQFKVLRRGCWQKINFQRPEPQPNLANGSNRLLTSPWVQHFRSARKPQVVTSPALQESAASKNQAINLSGRKIMFCGTATSSKHFLCNSYSCHQDLVDSNTGALINILACFLEDYPYCYMLEMVFFPNLLLSSEFFLVHSPSLLYVIYLDLNLTFPYYYFPYSMPLCDAE